MKNLNTIAEQLFNEIRGRFPNIEIGDADGNITNEPQLARFYDFKFESNGEQLGSVSVSLDEDDGVVIMFNKDFVQENFGSVKTDWYSFLKNIRSFSKKRLLNFEVRDINRTNLTKRDYKFLATNRRGEETMAESKMYGKGKTSFQKIGNAKLSIKHTGTIEEGSSRTQKIGAIYIENTDGERFKYPFKHLSGARALAMHIGEGGNPYDAFGKHITGLSEELSNLRKFKQYMARSSVMAESLAGHMDIVKERMSSVKKEIQNLQKSSYYTTAFENFVPADKTQVPEEVAENWIDQLTVKQFNEELKDVFPYIYNLVSEATQTKELTFDDIIAENTQDAINYEVLPGDTITSIVQSMNDEGIETTVDQVMIDNKSTVDSKGNVKAGTLLKIREPGAAPATSLRPQARLTNIGAGGTSEIAPNGQATGSTRGIDPKLNYGESIESAIDSLLGQFAESEQDTDEGNAFAKRVRDAKDKGMKKGDKIKGPDGDEITLEKEHKIPLGEFILSYFDRESGQFPKGPTAVLTMVEKEYGEQYVRPAGKFIERIDARVAEVMGYRDNELEEDNIGEGFLKNLVGDVRNAFKPGVAVTPNMVKELEAGVAAIKAGGQPTPRQQKIFDRFMSDTLPRELQKMGINMNEAPTGTPSSRLDTKGQIPRTGTPTSRLDTKGETPPAAPTDEPVSQGNPGATGNYEMPPDFDRAKQVGGTVYNNDAEAIRGLMAKQARSTEETQYLTMLARTYDFYGKPENIGAAIEKINKAIASEPRKTPAASSGGSTGGNTQGYTPKDFPSMAAAMAKVDYYEPGGKISINGVPHVRDVDENGRKFFRPVEGTSAPTQGTGTPSSRLDTKGQTPTRTAPAQGQPTSRLDTKGQTPSRESVELNRIKGLAGL